MRSHPKDRTLSFLALCLGLALSTVPSSMAASPGSALRFDGAAGFVQVAHHPSLNSYPFTATAWFRTTNNAGVVQGIVSKYVDSSYNGWALMVVSGRLRGFYLHPGGYAIDATSAADVADGFWHHAALVVDALGGRLYLDGALVGSASWFFSPGAPSTTTPLQIGRYDNYGDRFLGDLDEVTVWTRALSPGELNYLKHRQLTGTEHGLAALWHLDENAGTAAVDGTGRGLNGTLMGSPRPAWIPSTAPIVFNQVAGTALNLDGVDDYVSVNHQNNLNAYPLTVTAWVRTTRNAPLYESIVSKYPPGGLDGYSLFVQQGRIRAWYFRNNANYVWNPSGDGNGIDGGFVADGNWHHVALVISASGGTIYVDGTAGGSLPWTGVPGSPSTGEPLLLARSSNTAPHTNSLPAVLDEVTLWNRAVGVSEIQSLKNLPLAGNEPGLMAYWKFNEGSGTTAADSTGLGHTGAILGGPGWVSSTAFLGDGTSVGRVEIGGIQWVRDYAVDTSPTLRLATTSGYWLRRLDDFGAPAAAFTLAALLESRLQGTLAGVIPLLNNSTQVVAVLGSYNAAIPQLGAGGVRGSTTNLIRPQVQLDSVNDTFRAGLSHTFYVNAGPLIPGETVTAAARPLMHFNGHLFFGSVDTTFSSLAFIPARGSPSGGGVSTVLGVNNNSGALMANPAFHYGDGTPLNAVLLSNGNALTAPGTTVSLTGAGTDCIQNICFTRSGITLGTDLIRGKVTLQLPLGFSVCTNDIATNRLTIAHLDFPNQDLDTNLRPAAPALVLMGPLFAVDETKPFWIQTPHLSWLIQSGQIVIDNPTGLLFVRQQEDDLLTTALPRLGEPEAAYRISNDSYYRNVGLGPSPLITIAADTNGGALMSVQLALNPPELRPHFPYAGAAPSGGIPTGLGGQLVFANGLIQSGNSFLPVAGPVPATYARDCSDTACGTAVAGPATLMFTPAGNRLDFTRDGGLLAYGAISPANLTWGYAGGGQYAQRTSDVQQGAWTMAGTVLRNGESPAADLGQRPGVLLLTGVGDASNPAYRERPLQSNYADGFANYPGLNFRAPAQGQSFIADTLTPFYALTPRSKYYLRHGGVSGIHESAAFPPASLMLYGYSFTFTSYRLSYLDSDNWESRTDGAIAFPAQPAGFTQEFERMRFVCRGALDSAQVPSASGTKHLNYWNVDFKAQSIQFHPYTNDVCGTGPRVLVLGVETKLPFIPQALHAALGFKPNGNLVTAANPAVGVDSRFPLPAVLSLQGPGGSRFPISTVGEGYFNNWERSDRPAEGFYSLAGKLDVPFFEDIKAHLHITPTGPSTSQMSLMGGWPAAEGLGEDRGWTVAGKHYFNDAKFDLAHGGWPTGIGFDAYRRSSTEQYHPRAQRDWIEVAKFNYPLQWNPTLRKFAGFQDAKVILPVIDVNSRLKEVTPGKVDFDFAQDISVQLPRIKVLDFLNDAQAEVNGALSSVSNAIRQELGAVLNTVGLNALQQVLRENARGFYEPVLGPVLDPVVDNLQPALARLVAANPAGFPAQVAASVTASSNGLATAISGLKGATGQVNSVIGRLDTTLKDVEDTIALMKRVLEKDGSGNRHVVRVIVQQLVQDQGPGLGFVTGLADGAVNSLLSDLEPTLAQIEKDLAEVQTQFATVRTQLGSVSGEFNSALSVALGDSMAVQGFLGSAGMGVSNLLVTLSNPAGDFLTADPAAAKRAIKDRLTSEFLASALPAKGQRVMRGFLQDKDALLNLLMDALFDEINRSIRDGLSSLIVGAQDGAFKNMKGAGFLSQSLLAAKIRGAPTFNGDSLRRIHLDSAVQLNLPDEIKFTAYMDIKELDSTTVAVSCIPPGAPAAEVTLGARDVPLNWVGVLALKPLTVSVEARWTQQKGSVIGIGGMFDIKGEAGFKGCSVRNVGATLAIGAVENYFAAKAAATVMILGVPVDFHAGVFGGKACTLDPLKFIDPEADQVLVTPGEFSGVYVNFGGGLSLSDILFGQSSCLLDVRAGINTAIYYQGGPRFGIIGGRQKTSLDVDLICFLSGHVDWALFMAFNADTKQLTVGGSANVCGEIGYCPFCVEGCKGITLTGIVTDGGIDYHVDY